MSEEKEQFLVLQNLFHTCDIKCRRLEEENEKLKEYLKMYYPHILNKYEKYKNCDENDSNQTQNP